MNAKQEIDSNCKGALIFGRSFSVVTPPSNPPFANDTIIMLAYQAREARHCGCNRLFARLAASPPSLPCTDLQNFGLRLCPSSLERQSWQCSNLSFF